MFASTACNDASWHDANCDEVAPAGHEVRPVIEGVSEPVARQRVAAYFNVAACQGELPKSSFEPFFFAAADLGRRYRVERYESGFGKQPTSLRIKTDTGMRLLFCFNQQVINCDQAQRCECPYDFNAAPQRASEAG